MNEDRIEEALQYLGREVAKNRAYINQLRGEGTYVEDIKSEADGIRDMIDRKLHPENWR